MNVLSQTLVVVIIGPWSSCQQFTSLFETPFTGQITLRNIASEHVWVVEMH